MSFSASDLRYKPEQSYPALYAYLQRHAQRHLGPLMYDDVEVDTVVGHVVEQLVKLGVFGGGNATPKNALDRLSDAQFYAFLNTSVKNKAIDRLRKRRLAVSNVSDLEIVGGAGSAGGGAGEDTPMNDAVSSIWGTIPFAHPEEITLHLASTLEMRNMIKHCIMLLETAPHQLEAVIQELQGIGANDLLHVLQEEFFPSLSTNPLAVSPSATQHMSQHKDHAHKRLRRCLQQQSTNLIVILALRLTQYGTHSSDTNEYTVEIQTLAQDDLTEDAVRTGLNALVGEKLLTWSGEQSVRFTSAQMKRLTRYYREE